MAKAFKPKIIDGLKKDRPFFNISEVKLSTPRYVAWIDLMGMSSVLSISSVRAAIFIGKLHDAILRSRAVVRFQGNLYPMVDGCYVVSQDRRQIQSLLKSVFRMAALEFIHGVDNFDKCMMRAAISFGQVVEGPDLKNASNTFIDNETYSAGILLGTPLALAHRGESRASPFGVWVDESARHFCPTEGKTLRYTFWEWWTYPSGIAEIDDHCDQIENNFAQELYNYLDWCERNSLKIQYDDVALQRHKKTASQYFHSWPR